MRELTAGCSIEAFRNIGSKPVNILNITFRVNDWEDLPEDADPFEGGDEYWFADADITAPVEGIGKILSLTNFSSSVKINTLDTVSTVSVTLDDTDLQFFQMLGVRQFIGSKASVYQSFHEIDSKFELISGKIAGKVKWDTANRKFSFDISDAGDAQEIPERLLFGSKNLDTECIFRSAMGTFKAYDQETRELRFVQHYDDVRDRFNMGGESRKFLIKTKENNYVKVAGGLFEVPDTNKSEVKFIMAPGTDWANLPYYDEPISIRPATKEHRMKSIDGYLSEIPFEGVTEFNCNIPANNVITGGFVCVEVSKLFFPRITKWNNMYVSRRILRQKNDRMVIESPFTYVQEVLYGNGLTYKYKPTALRFERSIDFSSQSLTPGEEFDYSLTIYKEETSRILADGSTENTSNSGRIKITEVPMGFDITSFEVELNGTPNDTVCPLTAGTNEWTVHNLVDNDEIVLTITATVKDPMPDKVTSVCRVQSTGIGYTGGGQDEDITPLFPAVGDDLGLSTNRFGHSFLWGWQEVGLGDNFEGAVTYADMENYITKCTIIGLKPPDCQQLLGKAFENYYQSNRAFDAGAASWYLPVDKQKDWENTVDKQSELTSHAATYKFRSPNPGEPQEGDEIYKWQDYHAVYTAGVDIPLMFMYPPIGEYTPEGGHGDDRSIPEEYYENKKAEGQTWVWKDLSGNYMPQGQFGDDIKVPCTSTLSENPVEAIKYLIEHYTPYEVNEEMFEYVAERLIDMPISLLTVTGDDVFRIIEKIAKQFALAVYLKDFEVFIKDLTEELNEEDSVYTIDDNVIIEKTDSFSSNPAESLISRYTYHGGRVREDTPHIMLGKEEDFDVSYHRSTSAMDRVVDYWFKYNSKPWIIFNCKLPLTGLVIEPGDTVKVETQGIDSLGRVLKTDYDSKKWLVSVDVWLPINGDIPPWIDLPEAEYAGFAHSYPIHEWWYYDNYKEGDVRSNLQAYVESAVNGTNLLLGTLKDPARNITNTRIIVPYKGTPPASGEIVVVNRKKSANANDVQGEVVSPQQKELPVVGGVGGGASLYVAKIVSGTGTNHTADIYSNIDKTATETGVTLKILQIDSGESIPADTYLPCWEQEWGAAGSETTEWTSDIARSY